MNIFANSISQVTTGAARAVKNFPAVIISAFAFAVVTMIRIQLDWPQQEAYNFLFNCLHWSFALGAVFGLTAVTYVQSRINQPRAFIAANLLTGAVVLLTFISLYFFGGADSTTVGKGYLTVSATAAARVTAAMFIALLAFIYLAGFPREQSDPGRSFFMTHKAFFTALIYGGVIAAGTTGVASAVQVLLYEGMSEKVYLYIITLVGFLSFTIFTGYFPDFRKGETDPRRETAQKQPRFVEIIFEYILIPVVLTLTAVLLLWAIRTVIGGMRVSFIQLAGIASSYTLIGIWLYIMATHNLSSPAKTYRRFYPFAGLIILFFELWALINQLNKSGLKTAEYSFAALWIIALASIILLILKGSKAYPFIFLTAAVVVATAVLPVVGYHDLPIKAQVNRLEKLLIAQNMLQEGRLLSAETELSKDTRESLTDAVLFLASSENSRLPDWFDKNLADSTVFKSKLGFEPVYPEPDYPPNTGGYLGTNLMLPTESIDISNYSHGVVFGSQQERGSSTATVHGTKGIYKLTWFMTPGGDIPKLEVALNDKIILSQDMKEYINRLSQTYPPSADPTNRAKAEDMVLRLENKDIALMLVFQDISINVDVHRDTINYYMYLSSVYLREK